MSKIAPCLWRDGDAEPQAERYARLFPDSRVLSVARWGEGGPYPAGTALMVELELAGQRFQLLNGGPQFTVNPSVSYFVQVGDDAVRALYAELVDGGRALMPLGEWPWSRCYAWVEDRFGVSWQLMGGDYGADEPVVLPCLMFSDERHGLAGAAIRQYTALFPDAAELFVDRYTGTEPGAEAGAGLIKHGRFTLAGQTFVAMDSHVRHGFSFTEGTSFSVRCADQAEVDRYWDGLTADGGEPSRCGWLKDRFGLSWQVVPDALLRLQSTGSPEARGRTTAAMLQMGKLDVAALEAAWAGTSV